MCDCFFGLAAGIVAVLAVTVPATAGAPAQEPVLAERAAEAADALGDAVFSKLSDDPSKNVVISPYNIATALHILAQGADGKTRDAFETGLHLSDNGLKLSQAAEAMRDLRAALAPGDGATLETANSLWVQHTLPLVPDFVAMAKHEFSAEIRNVDFADPATLAAINGWVAVQTHDKIPQTLDRLNPNTVMAIVSALYFKGAWLSKFDPALTAAESFLCGDGSRVSVPMMHRKGALPYLDGGAAQAVALPFRGGSYEMVLLLPRPGREADVRRMLSQGSAMQLAPSRFRPREGTLALPRLKLAWGEDILLPLQASGMGPALSGDYSRMSPVRLLVSQVIHKTVFEMDEQGAEAAAVTAIVLTRSAPSAPFEMALDRPFYFLLRERKTGTTLFIGYVADPGTRM